MTQPITNTIEDVKRAAWDEAYKSRPLSEVCSREITIDIVGCRCIYINDFRVWGGKPYVSENLPTTTKKSTVRAILEAFSTEELQAYLEEKVAVNAYCAGLRNFRDGIKEEADVK